MRKRAVDMMEWSSLELRVVSCRGIKAFNLFQKLSVCVVVSLTNDELKKEDKEKQSLQRQKTAVDREGGRNPEWNHVMQFDLKAFSPERASHLFLKFDICCEGVIFGSRTIGEVRVPLKDLIEEFNGAVRYVSYQIRNGDGKPNGVLNFSYKVDGKTKKTENDSPKITSSSRSHVVTEEVHLPIRYPSLDDIHHPLPRIDCPSPKLKPGLYGMNPSPLSGACYHSYASQLVQTSGLR